MSTICVLYYFKFSLIYSFQTLVGLDTTPKATVKSGGSSFKSGGGGGGGGGGGKPFGLV